MRFLHTADWHLGRIFHGRHLTGDQAVLLDQVVEMARDSRVDAVIVAGDVYDRSVPPPDAVALLGDVLERLVLDVGTRVVLVAGNHDSPERLGFGSRLLERQGLVVAGRAVPDPVEMEVEDAGGLVRIVTLPHAEPSVVRERLGDVVHDHEAAMRARLARLGSAGDHRTVLVAHAFVGGGDESDSERPLSVGGTGRVSLSCFADLDYVALGHLHRPQRLDGDRVVYPGSLMRYSFSEVDHEKSVSLVEMDVEGACRLERLPLTPRRQVRIVEGTLADLLDRDGDDDYVLARILDAQPLLDAMGRLREVWPNVLAIERPALVPGDVAGPVTDHRTSGPDVLFRAFWDQVAGEKLSEEQSEAWADVLEQVLRDEREAGS